ncbi:MAG: hypothetical protein IJO85_07015 [Lachnospiraceae bacterium]|nr:hypothetical protein [Lachnospiraceae bacterium]
MSIVEKELTKALLKFSFGKMSLEQAEETAKKVAPNYDLNNEMLMHKGINWYAKQIIANM